MILLYVFKEVTLDLKELKFNKSFYQRINECFQRYQNKFELLVCWESNSKIFVSP